MKARLGSSRILARFLTPDFRAENSNVLWYRSPPNDDRHTGLNRCASIERFTGTLFYVPGFACMFWDRASRRSRDSKSAAEFQARAECAGIVPDRQQAAAV